MDHSALIFRRIEDGSPRQDPAVYRCTGAQTHVSGQHHGDDNDTRPPPSTRLHTTPLLQDPAKRLGARHRHKRQTLFKFHRPIRRNLAGLLQASYSCLAHHHLSAFALRGHFPAFSCPFDVHSITDEGVRRGVAPSDWTGNATAST